MKKYVKEIEWDTNRGYGKPFFTVTVTESGDFTINCYDEYIVELSDVGLKDLKDAVDRAISNKKKTYGYF